MSNNLERLAFEKKYPVGCIKSIDDDKTDPTNPKYKICGLCRGKYTPANHDKHCKTKVHQIYVKIFEKFGNSLFD